MESIRFSRVWAMPSRDTFDIKPIGELVNRYISKSKSSCDPFARNKRWATYTNDLNPETEAEYHMDAREFLLYLSWKGVKCDLAIIDPPYSPRQISECYKSIGLPVGMKDTQNAVLYSSVKDLLLDVLLEQSFVLSFGWNSSGMGRARGFEVVEIQMVNHGGAHNDTICMVEKRIQSERVN